MSVLIATLGCTLSLKFAFELSQVITALAFVVLFGIISKLLNVEHSFFQPSDIELEMTPGSEIRLGKLAFELDTIWASPVLVIFCVSRALNGKVHRARVLLGRDTLSDEQWWSVQAWRVWRQRG
jgi:hypothetical protein